MRALPKINASYWLTLMAASTFGTNTGDFVSDSLHIGHLAGLPWLAAALAAIFLTERVSAWASPIWFWLVIIVVRTAATNVGDAFHDFQIGFGVSVPLMLALFAASVWAYAVFSPRFSPNGNANEAPGVNVSPLYWLCMVMAGVLGTVGGDFMSFGAHLSPAGTAIVFGAVAGAATVVWGRGGRLLQPAFYWTTLALIRTAGTGAGDALAHDVFGLPLATVVTGVVFFGMVGWFYALTKDKRSVVAAPAR